MITIFEIWSAAIPGNARRTHCRGRGGAWCSCCYFTTSMVADLKERALSLDISWKANSYGRPCNVRGGSRADYSLSCCRMQSQVFFYLLSIRWSLKDMLRGKTSIYLWPDWRVSWYSSARQCASVESMSPVQSRKCCCSRQSHLSCCPLPGSSNSRFSTLETFSLWFLARDLYYVSLSVKAVLISWQSVYTETTQLWRHGYNLSSWIHPRSI